MCCEFYQVQVDKFAYKKLQDLQWLYNCVSKPEYTNARTPFEIFFF